jgi:hypothetical protein
MRRNISIGYNLGLQMALETIRLFKIAVVAYIEIVIGNKFVRTVSTCVFLSWPPEFDS